MPHFVSLADIRVAHARIAGTAVRTPLLRLDPARLEPTLLEAAGFRSDGLPEIYLKDESAQPIGSFKLRGAYNKIAQLGLEQLKRGVITYSSGNHAQGVAFAARALGSKAVIVMPENAPAVKRAATAALGAEIVKVGPASTERKAKAEELEAQFGYTMVPPYDDPAIIAGQGTCGLEILEQLPNVELVLSPVSGGGLLSGVATAIKSAFEAQPGFDPARKLWPGELAPPGEGGHAVHGAPFVWGCEPELAGDAKVSFDGRALVEWPASKTSRTIADGLRTQSLGQQNFEHILRFVDGIVTVTEDEIRAALKLILHATDIVAEPSGAVTLAAALFHREQLPAVDRIVAIVSGGNLDPALRAELESEGAASGV